MLARIKIGLSKKIGKNLKLFSFIIRINLFISILALILDKLITIKDFEESLLVTLYFIYNIKIK